LTVIVVAGMVGVPAEALCTVCDARWAQPDDGSARDSLNGFAAAHRHDQTAVVRRQLTRRGRQTPNGTVWETERQMPNGTVWQTERQWQTAVIETATMLGWAVYHTLDSRGSTAGWPDLALCRPPRFILAELKTRTGQVGPAQQTWLDLLAACPPIEVHTWRPDDIDDVIEILR
jgi:hypothetical protein